MWAENYGACAEIDVSYSHRSTTAHSNQNQIWTDTIPKTLYLGNIYPGLVKSHFELQQFCCHRTKTLAHRRLPSLQ